MSVLPAAVDSLPPPDVIRRTAETVIQRRYFKLDVSDYALAFWERFFDVVHRLLSPLFRVFNALYNISPVLAWISLVALFAIAVALIVHIVYTFKAALRNRTTRRVDLAGNKERARNNPVTWEREAHEAAAQHDYVSAVRYLFRACLIRLEQFQKRRLRPGVTNREVLRRFRHAAVFEPLSLLVEMVDVKWYGKEPCSEADYRQGVVAHVHIRQLTGRSAADAHGT